MRSRLAPVLAVLVVLTAACSRDEGTTSAGGGATTTAVESGATTTSGSGDSGADAATLLDNGGFGDLAAVCQDGDAGSGGATDVGVTADEIRIGTLTDKGFVSRPGLTQEMYDAAVAFAAWCNEHGGILGRQLVIEDRDAALSAYNDQIIEACGNDFALVGGGAVLDDSDNGGRVACGLPNIAGYVVSATARVADLQVQPVPNPVYTLSAGHFRAIAEARPELIDGFGIMTVGFGSTITVRDADVEAVEQLGYTVVYSEEYSAGGESNWRPFVEAMQSAGVKILEFVGEPENLALLQAAMADVGYFPELTIQQTNFYSDAYLQLAGGNARNTFIRTAYTPFELAADNKATQDYLDLMAQYNPSGRVAQLGQQATSALLLFARAATACGADLTRACLLEQASGVHEWTGGGMHAETDPGAGVPPSCFLLMEVTADAFVYSEELTQPNEGIFNCSPDNIIELQNDYGVPR